MELIKCFVGSCRRASTAALERRENVRDKENYELAKKCSCDVCLALTIIVVVTVVVAIFISLSTMQFLPHIALTFASDVVAAAAVVIVVANRISLTQLCGDAFGPFVLVSHLCTSSRRAIQPLLSRRWVHSGANGDLKVFMCSCSCINFTMICSIVVFNFCQCPRCAVDTLDSIDVRRQHALSCIYRRLHTFATSLGKHQQHRQRRRQCKHAQRQ